MRKTRGMRLLSFALTLAIVLTLGVSAFAEGSYAADQSYTQDKSQENVYAVKLRSAVGESCEELRDRLLAAGFDAYLYETDGKTVVMCGKFRSMTDAVACREEISEAVSGLYGQDQPALYQERYGRIVTYHDGQNTERFIRMAKADGIL